MAELRQLFEQAVGDAPAAVPLTEIKSRGLVLRRRRRAGAAAAAALAFAAGLVLVTGIGQFQKKQPLPATDVPRSIQLVRPGPLDTGRYEDPVFQPRVSFAVPEQTAWRAVLVKSSGLVIATEGSPPTTTLALLHWTGVHDPATGKVSTASAGTGGAGLIHWLATHPSLRVLAGPAATDLAGRPGQMLTFTLAKNPRLPARPSPDCPDHPTCLALFETLDTSVVVGSRERTTVITRDGDPSGLVLVLTVHGTQDIWDSRDQMDMVAASLRLGE